MLVGVASLPFSFPLSGMQAFYSRNRQNCIYFCNTLYFGISWNSSGASTLCRLGHSQAYLVLPLQVELLKLGYYHTIVTDGQATTWLQQCFLIHKIVNKARHKLVRLLGSSETLYTIQKQFQSRSLLKLSFICLIPQSKNLQTC